MKDHDLEIDFDDILSVYKLPNPDRVKIVLRGGDVHVIDLDVWEKLLKSSTESDMEKEFKEESGDE